MNSETVSAPSRRAFLQRSSLMAAAGVAAPWALQLAAMGEAAAFNGDDYKALVCVFLYGGNDYANTVVTYDEASHRRYADIRAAGAGSAADGIVLYLKDANMPCIPLCPTWRGCSTVDRPVSSSMWVRWWCL